LRAIQPGSYREEPTSEVSMKFRGFHGLPLTKVSGNHTHQPRLKVLAAGYLDIWVTREGVRSNTVSLSLGN
jgi:hypothetical protein